jgi:hypothetical protein
MSPHRNYFQPRAFLSGYNCHAGLQPPPLDLHFRSNLSRREVFRTCQIPRCDKRAMSLNNSFLSLPLYWYSDWLRAGRQRGRTSSLGRVKNFLHLVRTGSKVHPVSYPMCTGGSFPGVKRPGCEADHSPSTSAEVKKMWICTSTPPYAFMAQCLIS